MADSGASSTPTTVESPIVAGVPSLALQAELERGTPIGRYVVLEVAGIGGMGRVYRAYDPRLRREVALKLLRQRSSTEAEARMLREARAMAQLAHPNVVHVYDVDQAGDAFYIAMEYVGGRTLQEWLAETAPNRHAIVDVLVAAGRGLQAAHERGIVHRDFKPRNVMVADDPRGLQPYGRVQVMDFGIARTEWTRSSLPDAPSVAEIDGDTHTKTGTALGTLAYMAPEQLDGGDVDPRCDQFAFGITLYEALTGQRPFVGTDVVALRESHRAGLPAAPLAGVPAAIVAVIRRATALAREDRFPSMVELLAALARDPTIVRRRWIAVSSVAAAVAALIVWQRVDRSHALAACDEAAAAIDEVWNADTAGTMRTAFVATGTSFAADTAERTATWLDRHAEAWRAARSEVCRDTSIDGTLTPALAERATACLDHRRDQFAALVAVLGEQDRGVVRNAVQMAAGLEPLVSCTDPVTLARGEWSDDPEVRAEVERIRRMLSESSVLVEVGRHDEALVLVRAAITEADALGLPGFVTQARVQLGSVLEAAGEYPKAAEELRAAFFTAGELGEDRTVAEAATILVHVTGHRLARPSEALEWGRLAEMWLERIGERDTALVAGLELHLGVLHQSAGDFDQALERYESALAAMERASGPEHPDVARVLTNIASLHYTRGDYEKALLESRRAVELKQRTLGAEHPDVASSLNNLGIAHYVRGDLAEAKRVYSEALAIKQRAFGSDHPDLASSLDNLGIVELDLGNTAEAVRLHERSYELTVRALGSDHPAVAMSLDNLGNAYSRQGQLELALRQHERALEIRRHTLDAEHAEIANSYNNLGAVRRELGELEHAIEDHRAALAIWERALGREHPDVALALTNLGQDFNASGRQRDAAPVLERALAIRERAKTPADQRAETRLALAQALWDARLDRRRAVELARIARDELAGAGAGQSDADAWLLAHRSP